MRQEDLAHLEDLATVRLAPAERVCLLDDLRAMMDFAGRLPQVDTGDDPAPGPETAPSPTDVDLRPAVTFRLPLVTAGFPGWSPPFIVVPGLRRETDRETT